MKYNYEEMLALQKKTGVEFEVVDKCYRKAKGDSVKAEYLINKKTKDVKETNGFIEKILYGFKRLLRYKLLISKGIKTHINIQLWIVLLILLIAELFAYRDIGGYVFMIFLITLLFGIEYKVLYVRKNEDEKIIIEDTAQENVYPDENKIVDEVYDLENDNITNDDSGYVKVEIDK